MTKRIVVFCLVMQFLMTSANYFFVTHKNYLNASLNITAIRWLRIAGNNETVKQHCRRNCASMHNCKAYNVKLLEGPTSLGIFNCSFFDSNSCDWQKASLQNISTAGSQLWEKNEAGGMQAKPCAQLCGVKYRGDCTKCNKQVGWKGADCEIAPNFCSDIPGALSLRWNDGYKIWPWGAAGKNVSVLCTKWGTQMLQTYFNGKYTGVIKLGYIQYNEAMANYQVPSIMKTIDWPLISEVLGASKEKKLIVEINMDGIVNVYNFTNVEISPKGELTLTNNAGITAFPPSLNKAPFVVPPSANATCGPFWRFDPFAPNISVCSQPTRLMVFGPFMWDGLTANNYSFATFSFV